MNNLFKITLFGFYVIFHKHIVFCQNESLNLTKGKWNFYVSDTLDITKESDLQGTYKFKKSGKYLVKNISFRYDGKNFKKAKGEWSMKGKQLIIDQDDFDKLVWGPKEIEIIIIDSTIFYSQQKDFKTFYWIFRKEKPYHKIL